MSASKHQYSDVVLGFPEPAEKGAFRPERFPSKIGGRPIWLYRHPKIPPKIPRCSICLQPQVFLLQIYAPLESEIIGHDSGFHRMLYICICKSASCLKNWNCVNVLRAQLARENDYYPYSAISIEEEEEIENEIIKPLNSTCILCGFAGEFKCGQCHNISYCSKRCQMEDWKLGHKNLCGKDIENENRIEEMKQVCIKRRKWLFDEWEIITDKHATPIESDSDDFSDDEEIKVKEEDVENDVNIISGTMQDADEEELPEEIFRGKDGKKKDGVFRKFCRLVSYEPDQVIRYDYGGKELWGGENGQCKDSGVCERCGKKRIFEMQIMPQLVYYLSKEDRKEKKELNIEEIALRMRDDMDWNTIVVYTCEGSCTMNGESYVSELGYVQTSQQF